MEFLWTTLALSLFLAPAAAAMSPRATRGAAAVLGLSAAICAILALRGASSQAALQVTHSFAAFEGSDIVSKQFVTAEASAPARQLPALCARRAIQLALQARRARPEIRMNWPTAGPLLLAWGGSAMLLGLQHLAAPAPLALGLNLPPLPPFELAVWPALLAAALRLANRHRNLLPVLGQLSITVALAHLPLALFGTLATHHEWGTYLDVHRIDHIANPFTQMSTPLEPKSNEQLAWLVWTPQLVMWPAFSMLSTGGAAFAAVMIRRQGT